LHTYHTPLDLVRERSPERPVALARPDAVAVAARWFRTHFTGDVLYAVKANPSPWVLRALSGAGVTGFDVASLAEIKLVAEHAPGARMAFMHPVKSRAAIEIAHAEYGVRTFVLDSHEELAKILAATGGAKDLNLIVRLAVDAPGAAYTLNGKFGVSTVDAPELLRATRQATHGRMGISFHVGSQCMRPTAFRAAMAQASTALARAAVFADVVDVGGGFPSIYPGMTPPDLNAYMVEIEKGLDDMLVHEASELWCEPGRALVAESASLLVRVDLCKGDQLYINDGAYGSLFDAAHAKWRFPVKLVRPSGLADDHLRPFQFFGPTCDSVDHMPGPFWLPSDVREGDFIEIGMLGAYGAAMASRFNGYGDIDTAIVTDAPMASQFGLAPRELSDPGQQSGLVIRMTRNKTKKRRRR